VTSTDSDALGGPALGPAEAPSNGAGPAPSSPPAAEAEAEGCADCEDGLDLGGRTGERALGLLGMVMGGLVVAMGFDLFTGGALSRILGLGSGDGTARP
jgi:hypothetical protein